MPPAMLLKFPTPVVGKKKLQKWGKSTCKKQRTLNLGGMLSKYRSDASALQPIVVRRLDNETYGLVLGFKAYCIAKILGIKEIKAHITDFKRQDLVKYNLEVEVGYF